MFNQFSYPTALIVCRVKIASFILVLLPLFCIAANANQTQHNEAESGLSLNTRVYRAEALPNQNKLTAKFEATNQTEAVIFIKDVRTTCDCVASDLKKSKLAPGEKTVIQLNLLGQHTPGKQHTSALIVWHKADRNTMTTTKLDAYFTIPQYFDISPQTIIWQHHESLKTKTATIEVIHDTPIAITGIELEGDHFDTELQTLEPGRRYRLKATPGKNPQRFSFSAKILLQTSFPNKEAPLRPFILLRKNPPASSSKPPWVKILTNPRILALGIAIFGCIIVSTAMIWWVFRKDK